MNTNNARYKIQIARYKTTIVVVVFLALQFFVTGFAQAQVDEERIKENFFKGQVTEVVSSEEHRDFGEPFTVQKVRVELRGDEKKTVVADYSFHSDAGKNRLLKKGDRVVVVETSGPVETIYSVSDVYRLNMLLLIVALFFFLVVLFAGKRGLFSFLGLGFTIFVLMWYMVPRLATGVSPLLVTTVGVLLIAAISLYIAHGWRRRTHIAFLSTLLCMGFAYVFSGLFVKWVRLFGGGSEAAFYLQSSETPLDLHGLLLAGMIVGALGVLDDITTAQAAAVEEIHLANPALSRKEIYRRGLSVGREHISSLVNTLVLAYTGASLPMLLLFYIYPRPLWVTLNSELMIEEIVRTLVGSMTLIIAVPLTTLFAAAWIKWKQEK